MIQISFRPILLKTFVRQGMSRDHFNLRVNAGSWDELMFEEYIIQYVWISLFITGFRHGVWNALRNSKMIFFQAAPKYTMQFCQPMMTPPRKQHLYPSKILKSQIYSYYEQGKNSILNSYSVLRKNKLVHLAIIHESRLT